jgi:galactokinase
MATDAPDFLSLFGRVPNVVADAPGRVNLIGEHTDYNGGFVLPTPIPRHCRVELAPRSDHLVRAGSANVRGADAVLEYTVGAEEPGRGWLDYVQGITHVLRQEGLSVPGFDVRIQSSVPLGSGLASSAALEVGLLRALRAAFALGLDDLRLALVGKRVENEFVGARTGVMDQMAASLASEGHALFIDTRSLEYRQVPLPDEADLVVLGSGVSHQHARGDYNTRRAECERACALLGVAQLRDLTVADLPALSSLPEPLGRRAHHVVTENDRVHAAVEAMCEADLEPLGALFYASHASQRDLYEVSIPEIDLIVELARAHSDVYGARLTGGGFGGSVVILARAGTGHETAQRIAQAYAHQSGRTPAILVPDAP